MYCKLERQRGEEIVLQYSLAGGWIVSQYKNCIVTEVGQCGIAIQSLGHDTALGAQAGVRGARRRGRAGRAGSGRHGRAEQVQGAGRAAGARHRRQARARARSDTAWRTGRVGSWAGARTAGRSRRGRAGRWAWVRGPRPTWAWPGRAWCAGWASWASFGTLCTWLSSGSVFGPVRLGIFLSHQMNTVHCKIKIFLKFFF